MQHNFKTGFPPLKPTLLSEDRHLIFILGYSPPTGVPLSHLVVLTLRWDLAKHVFKEVTYAGNIVHSVR